MSATKVNLWFIRETEQARKYFTIPPERHPDESNTVWVPKSIIEHTSKNLGGHHLVTLPDWFISEKGL